MEDMVDGELTPKQDKFLKEYLRTGNGTQAALKAYDTVSENTAAQIASENLRKPSILEKFREAQGIAHSTIVALATGAENEAVRLNAAKDIMDRTEGKAIQRTDVTSGGEKIVAQFTDDEKENLLKLLNDNRST